MDYTAAHPTLPFGTIVTITNKHNMRRVTVRINDRGPFIAARIIDVSKAAAEALDMIATGTAPVLVESAVSKSLGPVSSAAAATPPASPSTATAPTQPTSPPTVTAATPPTSLPTATAPTPPVQQPPPAPPVTPQQTAVRVPPVYTAPPAVIVGGTPSAGNAKLYRIQVGAFKVPRNAVDVFDRLKAAGLNPRYEQYGDLYRVVLPELRAADIPAIAQTLGNTGFQEVLLREE